MLSFLFPHRGQDKNYAVSHQLPTTAVDLDNVRPYDVLENRERGGQRPGLDKKYNTYIGGADGNPVTNITSITLVEGPTYTGPDYNLLVGGARDGDYDSVWYLTDEGVFVRDFAYGTINDCGGLAKDADGNFFAGIGSVLYKFSPDGTQHPTWNGGSGVEVTKSINDVFVASTGKIYLAIDPGTSYPTAGACIKAYNADGTLYATGNNISWNDGNRVCEDSSGNIWLICDDAGGSHYYMFKYVEDLSSVDVIGDGGTGARSRGFALDETNNRLIFGFYYGSPPSISRIYLRNLSANTAIDNISAFPSAAKHCEIYDLILDIPNTNIYAVGVRDTTGGIEASIWKISYSGDSLSITARYDTGAALKRVIWNTFNGNILAVGENGTSGDGTGTVWEFDTDLTFVQTFDQGSVTALNEIVIREN